MVFFFKFILYCRCIIFQCSHQLFICTYGFFIQLCENSLLAFIKIIGVEDNISILLLFYRHIIFAKYSIWDGIGLRRIGIFSTAATGGQLKKHNKGKQH